jgi:sulfatase maturation enzyme AslB (radical SAM superfamily)
MYKFCSAPWDTVKVLADGSVYACLCCDWNSVGSLGNLLYDSLESIMQSVASHKLRSSVLDQTFTHCNSICPELWKLPERADLPPIQHRALPTTLLLSIDERCNLRCASCRIDNIFDNLINPVTTAVLEQLVRSYQHHSHPITLQVDGEGDVFASRAYKEFLARRDLPDCFRWHFITNGNLVMKNRELLTRLRDRIVSVDVSLDAATAETYSAIRGGRFDLVLSGIEWMISQGMRVNVSFVVQRRNYIEMTECWKLISSLGCHSINFQGIVRWRHMTNEWWSHNRLEDNPAVDRDLLISQLKILSKAPPSVDLEHRRASAPVHINGTLRQWIQQRPV